MGIVIITIPGEAKRAFANSLHEATGGKVELVIIQKSKPNHNSLISRIKRLYRAVGLLALPVEIFYAILIRASRSAKDALEYFRVRSGAISSGPEFIPKVMEVYSVNDDGVFEILQKISPELLVIWGSTIIKPHIIRTAKRAINLHMGLCPYYRGAIANQHAVMHGERTRIGATIHYAAEKVDSGDILMTIAADTSKPPRELFRELNDRAEEYYLDIASRVFRGETLPSRSQDIAESKNFLLKHWTPSVRYRLAKRILGWEKTGTL